MHYWGDEWFKNHGDDLYTAIKKIEKGLHKYGIGVNGKEKYGSYREEYLRFWDGSWYYIIFGPRLCRRSFHNYKFKPFMKFANFIHDTISWFDYYMIPYKKTKYGWLRGGIANFNNIIGITKLVWKWQSKKYNKVYQLVCKEYPDIVDELIVDTEGYKMIKPCKWGNVDGTAIHNKYWKSMQEIKADENENEI